MRLPACSAVPTGARCLLLPRRIPILRSAAWIEPAKSRRLKLRFRGPAFLEWREHYWRGGSRHGVIIFDEFERQRDEFRSSTQTRDGCDRARRNGDIAERADCDSLR